VPEISSLTVYQRSPNWVIPRLDVPISAFSRAVLRYMPPIRWRIRSTMMDFREKFHEAVNDKQSSMANMVRTSCMDLMKTQMPHRADLREKLTPDYSPGCKRVIISDDFYPALANPKTQLETTKIRRITESGIELEDGTHHTHDTIVLATGFRTLEFLHPINITGTQNRNLSSIWKDGAYALYGTSVPSLPNFGMFYGPNTNLGHNSIILMIEAQSRYLNALVAAVLDSRARGQRIGLVPNQNRTKEYNDELQQTLSKSSFADPNCSSWYKNKEGRITNNWSGTVIEYQEMLSRVDWNDFDVTSVKRADNVEAEKHGVKASKVVFGTGKSTSKIGRVHEEPLVSNMTLVLGVMGAIAAGATMWSYRRK
jgi:cation diffusion facilitator CzcD-associated flavoprotein CzcO